MDTQPIEKTRLFFLLFEKNTIGGSQSALSQGILHGGMKYTLSRNLPQVVNSLVQSQKIWEDCLEGTGQLDLKAVEVYSDFQILWHEKKLLSSVVHFAASKLFRSQVKVLSEKESPSWIPPKNRSLVFQVKEKTINVYSLFESFYSKYKTDFYQLDPALSSIQKDSNCIRLKLKEQDLEIQTKRMIVAAGAGNEEFIDLFNISQETQRRPLHMVAALHDKPLLIYGHCISGATKPLFTITSHPTSEGNYLWYFGGKLAEDGVKMDDKELIAHTKKVLAENTANLLPQEAEWKTIRIDRAEPKQSNFRLPDSILVKDCEPFIFCWPTKLVLAPALAMGVLELLKQNEIEPSHSQTTIKELPMAELGKPLWKILF